MCYFVVVGLPEKSAEKWLARLPEEMAYVESPYAELMRGLRGYVITRGLCSCDLFHGSAERLEEHLRKELGRRRRKYRSQGWSEAKTERALADYGRAQADVLAGLDEELRSWLCEAAREAKKACLFIHWESTAGDLVVGKEVRIPLDRLLHDSSVVEPEQLIHLS